jgi:hypothetical protein
MRSASSSKQGVKSMESAGQCEASRRYSEPSSAGSFVCARLFGESHRREGPWWYSLARLYSIRRAESAAYRIKWAEPASQISRFFSQMCRFRPAGISDKPRPSARRIISQVLYILSYADRESRSLEADQG